MRAHNLPHYSIPFVGRATEIAEILNRFGDPGCRLLTLVGPGGIGKTRLAVQVAAQCDGRFADGIYFVPFQPLASPDSMVSAIADATGVHFNPGNDPKQQLLHHLRKLELLLVLDNLEHLLDGVGLLEDVLGVVPAVKILATSRERLNLPEEWVFDVRELDYPATESETDIESYDAVKLFFHHVRRLNAHIDLSPLQQAQLIRICQLVGGMPLGIELAAAWARTLSYKGIAQGIERSLDMLETSSRNIEPRHRNLRATFDQMWNRLSDAQRSIFKRLSIFRGSFTWEAAEHITGASLHTLSSLVDRSLVRMDQQGRYDLHELLRQYAEERLEESPDEMMAVERLHCQFFAAYLANREKDLEGKRQQTALQEIQSEIDNIRAAWQWAIAHKLVTEIEDACHALWFFYDTRGWYQEGAQQFEAAATALETDSSWMAKRRVRGRLMTYYGGFCYSLNSPDKARRLLENSVAILRDLGARSETGLALLRLSEVALFAEDDSAAAQSCLRESMAIFRETGNDWGLAYSLRWLGVAVLYEEDYEQASRLAQASLAIYEQSNEPIGKALALGVICLSALGMGEFQRAQGLSQTILAICEQVGIRWQLPAAHTMAGAAARGLGDLSAARQHLVVALEGARELELLPFILHSVLETAYWLIAKGNQLKALELLSFVLQHPVPPIGGKLPVSHVTASLQDALPAEDAASAIKRGGNLSLDSVTEACLDALQRDSDLVQMGQHPADRLTQRELEVLGLVSKGLTNPLIAAELVLTVGTVKWYLHEIYTKLNVSNRMQAVARAQELNLLP